MQIPVYRPIATPNPAPHLGVGLQHPQRVGGVDRFADGVPLDLDLVRVPLLWIPRELVRWRIALRHTLFRCWHAFHERRCVVVRGVLALERKASRCPASASEGLPASLGVAP